MEEMFDYTRIPPHHMEAEQAVLGAILLDNNALVTVSEFLHADDFYKKAHAVVYQTALDLMERGEPVDLVTLVTSLQTNKLVEAAGGLSYITDLGSMVSTSANAEFYAKKIEEKSVLRRLIQAASEIQKHGYDSGEDLSDLLDLAEKKIFDVSQRKMGQSFAEISTVLIDVYERIERLQQQKKGVTGIPTGYRDLDKITSGFQRSDLIIIAARPSVGKTAFALNIAQNIGIHAKETVAIFSLEMAREQLVQRMLCAEAHVDANRLRSGFLEKDDWEKITAAMGILGEAPIYIDDSPNLTVVEMRAKLRRLKAERGLGIVLIDYLQLMRSHRRSENRQQEISEISRSLKGLARELDVPVIALSQLSRAVESRQDKRPLLSDIRESGSIEQDADIVGFLYRDDYYNEDTDKPNIIEIIIAKQRNGPTGKAELVFIKEINKFITLDVAHS